MGQDMWVDMKNEASGNAAGRLCRTNCRGPRREFEGTKPKYSIFGEIAKRTGWHRD